MLWCGHRRFPLRGPQTVAVVCSWQQPPRSVPDWAAFVAYQSQWALQLL